MLKAENFLIGILVFTLFFSIWVVNVQSQERRKASIIFLEWCQQDGFKKSECLIKWINVVSP